MVDHSHLKATYIPLIEAEQLAFLADEFKGEAFSIQFDGTTRLGEALVCVGRFCRSDFELHTRLLMCKTTACHVKGRQLASLITQLVCTTLKLDASNLVGMARDSASVNGSACRLLCQNPFSNSMAFLCISHTLNNAGDHFNLDVLPQWTTPWLELVGGRDPHRGAQSLWKETVAPMKVPGYSKTRWYSKAEIWFVLAQNFHSIKDFLDEMDDLQYGDATRKRMREIFDSDEDRRTLQLELATMLDMRPIVQQTYALEGDRLEILLIYRRIQELRALGESIKHYDDGCLPNLQATLRATMDLTNGTEIVKDFPPHGTFSGFIVSSSKVASSLYPGQEALAYKVRYPSDGQREDLEEDEIRPLLKTSHLPEFKAMCDKFHPAFEYLESRITGV